MAFHEGILNEAIKDSEPRERKAFANRRTIFAVGGATVAGAGLIAAVALLPSKKINGAPTAEPSYPGASPQPGATAPQVPGQTSSRQATPSPEAPPANYGKICDVVPIGQIEKALGAGYEHLDSELCHDVGAEGDMPGMPKLVTAGTWTVRGGVYVTAQVYKGSVANVISKNAGTVPEMQPSPYQIPGSGTPATWIPPLSGVELALDSNDVVVVSIARNDQDEEHLKAAVGGLAEDVVRDLRANG